MADWSVFPTCQRGRAETGWFQYHHSVPRCCSKCSLYWIMIDWRYYRFVLAIRLWRHFCSHQAGSTLERQLPEKAGRPLLLKPWRIQWQRSTYWRCSGKNWLDKWKSCPLTVWTPSWKVRIRTTWRHSRGKPFWLSFLSMHQCWEDFCLQQPQPEFLILTPTQSLGCVQPSLSTIAIPRWVWCRRSIPWSYMLVTAQNRYNSILASLHYRLWDIIMLQVYQRLQRLNLTVSHSSVIRLLESVGEKFDAQVKEWRDVLVSTLDSRNQVVSVNFPFLSQTDNFFLIHSANSTSPLVCYCGEWWFRQLFEWRWHWCRVRWFMDELLTHHLRRWRWWWAQWQFICSRWWWWVRQQQWRRRPFYSPSHFSITTTGITPTDIYRRRTSQSALAGGTTRYIYRKESSE